MVGTVRVWWVPMEGGPSKDKSGNELISGDVSAKIVSEDAETPVPSVIRG